MTEAISQHLPAEVKVGGRRLSISSKPKHHAPAELEPAPVEPAGPVDYPRPAPPGDEPVHGHPPPHTEEDKAKRERKHGSHDNEQKLKELPLHKAEMTRPTKDMVGGHKGFGAGGRIAQPAGKGLGV